MIAVELVVGDDGLMQFASGRMRAQKFFRGLVLRAIPRFRFAGVPRDSRVKPRIPRLVVDVDVVEGVGVGVPLARNTCMTRALSATGAGHPQ